MEPVDVDVLAFQRTEPAVDDDAVHPAGLVVRTLGTPQPAISTTWAFDVKLAP